MRALRVWVVVSVLAFLLASAVFVAEGSGGGPAVLSQGAQVQFAKGGGFQRGG